MLYLLGLGSMAKAIGKNDYLKKTGLSIMLLVRILLFDVILHVQYSENV